MVISNPCPYTAAAFLDAVNTLMAESSGDEPRVLDSESSAYHHYHEFARAHAHDVATMCWNLDLAHHTALLKSSLERCRKIFDSLLVEEETVATLQHQIPQLPLEIQHHDQSLIVVGKALGQSLLRSSSALPAMIDQLVWWTRTLMLAGIGASIPIPDSNQTGELGRIEQSDSHEASTRLAAVQAISAFFEALMKDESSLPIMEQLIPIYFRLYDALNDDDEDVRLEAAKISSVILSKSESRSPGDAKSSSYSSAATRSKFAQWLAVQHRSSIFIWEQALMRYVMCHLKLLRSISVILLATILPASAVVGYPKYDCFKIVRSGLGQYDQSPYKTWKRYLTSEIFEIGLQAMSPKVGS